MSTPPSSPFAVLGWWVLGEVVVVISIKHGDDFAAGMNDTPTKTG